MGRIIPAFAQFFDGQGDPLANGWLQFFVSGSNNTLKNTYYDPVYQIANTNPLQLDAEGRCPNVFGVGDYRVVSFINDPEDEDSPGEQLQVFDPVTAQGAIEGGTGTGTVFDAWDPAVVYDLGDIVTRNLLYYRSLSNLNENNDPELEEIAWEHVDFLVWWNPTVFYSIGEMVFHEDNLWFSLINSNQNNSPPTSPSAWRRGATGYKGCLNLDTNYTITSSDRDYIICLGPATAADSAFELPAMSVPTDGFRLGIINNSGFILTINAVGSAGVWLNSSGTLDIESGAFLELIYHSYTDNWDPIGNVGPVLGGQDIGTAAFPVNTHYVDTIDVDVLDVDTINNNIIIFTPEIHATSVYLPPDENIIFGDANASIYYDSVADRLTFSVPAGESIGFEIDGIDMWYVDSTGEFLPGASNLTPNIGSPTQSVDFLYANNVSLPTAGFLLAGDTDEVSIGFDGASGNILSSTSLNIGTTSAATQINWVINSTVLMSLSDGGLDTSENITVTNASPYLQVTDGVAYTNIRAVSPASYLDFNTANFYIRYTTTPLFNLASSGILNLYNHLYVPADDRIGWGSSYYFRYNSSATSIGVHTNNGTVRWYFERFGNFVPATTGYNIGSSTTGVNELYTRRVISQSDNLQLRFGAGIGLDFTHTVISAGVCDIYFNHSPTVGTYYIRAFQA